MKTNSLRSALSLLLFALPFWSACTTATLTPKIAPDIPLSAPLASEVDLEQLKRLLPRHRVVVGFDVDDTLLFSAPAFNALQPSSDPAVIRPKAYSELS